MKSKIVARRDLTLDLAKKIAETAAKHSSDLRLLYRDKGANAKSLMGVVALSYKKGAEILVVAEGKDAAHAIENLKNIL